MPRFVKTIHNIISGNESITDTLKFNLLSDCIIIIHLSLGFMFLWLKILPLSVYNFFILLLYLFIRFLIKRNHFVLAFVLAYLDIFTFSFTTTLLIGWDYGFSLYIIALVPISLFIAYSTKDFPRRTFYPLIFSLVDMIFYIACSYFSESLPVLFIIPDENLASLIYALNSTIAFSMIIAFSILFTFEIRNTQLVMERKNRRLDVIASLDPLTGLLNRRSMEEHMAASIIKAKEQDRTFSLVLCDIDDFKKVNDTYGHSCGDQVLIRVSDIIRSHMREFDFVCRWGGEEILILLDCDLAIAQMVAERIRHEISLAYLIFERSEVRFTMTFGISTYNTDSTIDSLIQVADEHLYVGKRRGKNIVVA